jgi:hypothetical protein
MSMWEEAATAADDLTREVMAFVDATSRSEVKCPREKSAMTPCIARDGRTALADDRTCVGCRKDPHALLKDHREKHPTEEKENADG